MRKHCSIRDNPIYRIYNDGRIYNKKSKRFIKPTINNNGYLRVNLGKSIGRAFVHRLVAMYFIPNNKPNEYNLVMHLDNNPLNNHYTNLKWGTQSMNIKQAYSENRITTGYKKGIGNGLKGVNHPMYGKHSAMLGINGENHPASKLTNAQYKEILKLRSEGLLLRELSNKFGVSYKTIRNIIKRYNYAYI